MILRKCNVCGLEANREEDLVMFKKDSNSKYGRANKCKSCMAKGTAKWAEDNPEKYREAQRKKEIFKKYGITVEEYERCMDTSVCCEICGSTEDLVYDHNHDTGDFRGVLCRKHNSAIGLLGDSEELILKAYKYLEERN